MIEPEEAGHVDKKPVKGARTKDIDRDKGHILTGIRNRYCQEQETDTDRDRDNRN